MGIGCIPVNFFFGLFQLSVEVLFFLLGFLGVAPPPNLSNSIGSIFGCNV